MNDPRKAARDESRKLLDQFDRLIDLPREARRAALQRIRQDDPRLADRLERLLATEDDAAHWIESLESSVARGLAAELDHAWAPGRIIGPYRLERLLATGGMDAVFLARKADGELKRPVALKLVPAGLMTDESVHRFRRERDLLAVLNHPHIAALLDAGVTDTGQPWFAMEFIEGERFDVWCEQVHRSLEECLHQFHTLVDAVAFAHRNLVVHGDLKPGNVMIDRTGRLRLLDFGIARLMDEMPEPDQPRYFTARYAAPEVIGGSRPGTAGDIYALGVMLGEMIETAESSGGPSIRDLRAIADRARAQAPEDRYDSARQLADELLHCLRGEPVMARDGGFGYRLDRRVRRHPWATLALIAASGALVAFAVVSHYQAERYAQERDKARELAGYLEQIFINADPDQAAGQPLTARELLDRGRERLTAATSNPAVRADFLSILGRTYQRLGDYETAGRLLDEALALDTAADHETLDLAIERAETYRLSGEFEAAIAGFRRLLEAPNNLDPPRQARALAGLGRTLAQAGRPGEAVPLLEESLLQTRALTDIDPLTHANRLNDTGSALFRLGRYDEATRRLEEALALRRRIDRESGHRHGSPRTATLINNLGLMHYLRGHPERAEPLLREALEMRRVLLADDHPDLAQTLTNLGLMLKDYGDARESVTLLEEALSVRRAGLEPDHYRVGQAMLNLAIAYRRAGRLGQADELTNEALDRLRATLGPTHPQVAVAHNERGALLLDLGNPAAAEAAHRRALSIQRAALPPEHPHLAWSLVGLGRALLARGDVDHARPLLEEAVTIREKALPDGDPLRQDARRELARADALLAKQAGVKRGASNTAPAHRSHSPTPR